MSNFDRSLKNKKIAFFDIDGTLALGHMPIPGAAEFVGELRRRGLETFVLTNNSSKSKVDYVKKMSGMGFEFSEKEIIISTDGLIAWFQQNGIDRAYILGTPGMAAQMRESGIAHEENSKVVAMGYDTTLNYEKMVRVAHLLQKGAEYYVTHPDLVCPDPEGPLPDAGSFIAMFEKATGRLPDKIFGKPSEAMIENALKSRGLAPHDAFMVGDRLYTDFQMCINARMDFICVLSGEATAEDIKKFGVNPALVVQSVAHILEP